MPKMWMGWSERMELGVALLVSFIFALVRAELINVGYWLTSFDFTYEGITWLGVYTELVVAIVIIGIGFLYGKTTTGKILAICGFALLFANITTLISVLSGA